MSHVHSESRNPRLRGKCDCGQRMPARMCQMDRDLEFERRCTVEAARGVDAVPIIEYAERRAPRTPVQLVDRSLLREVLEELADARNYLVWLVQFAGRMQWDNYADVVSKASYALAGVVLAFNTIHALQEELLGV